MGHLREQRSTDDRLRLLHAEDHMAMGSRSDEGRVVDWLGRSAAGRRLGGWTTSIFTLGPPTFCNAAFSGIFSNLVLYLIRVWDYGNAPAAKSLTNLLGTMFFTSAIGAFMGDAYWGRFWSAFVFQVILFMGCALASVAVTVYSVVYKTGDPPSIALSTFLFFALYLAALGNGSYEPAMSTLGGDQFDAPEDKSTFFNLFFIFSNVLQVPSLTVLTYLENSGKWALGFWISTAAVGIAVLLSILGARNLRQNKPAGNPVVRIVQVLVSASRKLNVLAPSDADSLFELPGQHSAIPGSRKINHTDRFRWLDKAATVTDGDSMEQNRCLRNAWHLCTVTQVEEVKCVVRILPFWIIGISFNIVVAQLTTLFVEQGNNMNARLGPKFTIPPGSMQLFNILSIISFATMYDCVLVPWLRGCTGHPKGLTSLQRKGIGLAVSIVAMVVAALVEMKRLEAAAKVHDGAEGKPGQHEQLSILWLIPQFVIVGLAQVCMVVGQMEFFYTQVSDGMRSLGSSMPLLCRGLGNYGSSILVTLVTAITGNGGKLGWIPKDLNMGHLDYFYWLVAALMLTTFTFFLAYSYHYTYLQMGDDEKVDAMG